MKVVCIDAPDTHAHLRLKGAHGMLEVTAMPQLGYIFTTEGSATIFIGGEGWHFNEVTGAEPIIEAARHFEPEQPTRPSMRQRESYDSEAFGEDLELAINHLRSTARAEHHREFSQPMLREGVSSERATYLVCLSLIERKLGEDFDRYLDQVLDDARVLLISKNQAYGNSALDPVRLFSKASLKEQLLVRLDDKVSRLARGQAAGEDVAADLLGYLLLVSIAEKRERG